MKKIKIVIIALVATLALPSCVRFVPMGQPLAVRSAWQGQNQNQNQNQNQQQSRYLKGANVTEHTPKNTANVQIFCYPKRGAGLTVEIIHTAEQKTANELSKNNSLNYTSYAKNLLSGLYDQQKDFSVKITKKTTTQQKTVFVPENEVSADIKARF